MDTATSTSWTAQVGASTPTDPATAHKPRLWVVGLSAMLALVVLALTAPHTTADAPEYARDIVIAEAGDMRAMIEPGHLAWRPLGVVLTGVLGLPDGVSFNEKVRVTQRRMTVVAIISGVISAVAASMLVLTLGAPPVVGVLAALLLACSAGFLNAGQAGTSYVSGLACLFCGVVLLWNHRAISLGRAALGGVMVACAVLLWLPYVLVMPGVFAGILIVRSKLDRRALAREAVTATLACAVVGLVSYALAASLSGIREPAAFATWIRGAAHEVSTGGLLRLGLGFPRSFLFMGHDGREVKRFLIGDTLNPVSLAGLMKLGLWPKMVVFYAAAIAAVVLAWGQVRARRWLLASLAASLPALWLALVWMGGDMERYLPLYPFLVPLAAWATWQSVVNRQLKAAVPLVALLALSLWNVVMLGPVASGREADRQLTRLSCLGDSLTPADILVVPHHGDPLYLFARNELDRLPRRAGTEVLTFIRPGGPEMVAWRDTMEVRVARQLSLGGRVWVARYVQDSVPPAEMGWVEGLDKRAGWEDIRKGWAQYDLQATCGGKGGFLRVREPRNPSS
jgi:hypothetical protein